MPPARPVAATPRPRMAPCGECGMLTAANEFHPLWHCVLFSGDINPRHLDPPDPRINAHDDLVAALRALVEAATDAAPVIVEGQRASREHYDRLARLTLTLDEARALLRDLDAEVQP